MAQTLTFNGVVGRALSIGILASLIFTMISLLSSVSATETGSLAPLTQIDDFTEYTYRVNTQPMGGIADFVVTRTFSMPIVSLRVTIVQGTADDLGYVGNLPVTTTSPGCGPAGQVVAPVDVTSQVTVNGNKATFLLRAQEDCSAFSNTGWGSQLCPGCGGVSNARFHWEVTLSDCNLSVTPSKVKFTATGGQGNAAVTTTPTDCSWTASTTEPSWISISPSSGNGAGSVNYTIAANTGNTGRTGNITIGNRSFTVRQYASGCAVSPLTPITDPQALIFESGNTINTANLVPNMAASLEAFRAHTQALGGSFLLNSAWRPDAYQLHLQEVYNKWQQLKDNDNPECQEIRDEVYREVRRPPAQGLPGSEGHNLEHSSTPPAGPGGPHTTGNAIDVTISGLQATEIRNLANAVGLCRPFPGPPLSVKIDRPHYVLRATDTRGECSDPPILKHNASVVRPQELPATSQTLPGVMVKVLRQDINGKFIYHYRLINNSNQIIVRFNVGNNNGDPELVHLPINWDSDNGTPYESSTSPLGWQAEAFSEEESEYHYLSWQIHNPAAASVPGQILCGFSVALSTADSTYTSANCQLILDDGSIYSTPIEPDDTPLISPAIQSFLPSGGSGMVTVTAPSNYIWQATSNDHWITINPGSNGTGNGTFSYSIEANGTPGNRVGTITVSGRTFTVFQGVQFNDVPISHPFYDAISKLSARGVTLGVGGGNYGPDQIVTREQMAAFIIKALGQFTPTSPFQQRFQDVPSSSPFYGFIEEMALRNITAGCGAGNYCPGGSVSREQMAAFIIKALGEQNPPLPQTQRFSDVPPSNPFYAFIDRMAVRGITAGCSASPPLYCPGQNVTRAQMAAFLVKAFGL